MKLLPIALPTETVHSKPIMDANGQWTTAAYALRKDANGWHDRPLLTSRDLQSPNQNAARKA